MKKIIYIVAFIFLGVLLQFILHAWVEVVYIRALISDFESYSAGLSWADWELIHHVVSAILLIGGAAFGFWQGKYWWQQIYPHTKSRNV